MNNCIQCGKELRCLSDYVLVDLTEEETSYGLSYEKVVPILVSAIKELSAKVEALENG